MSNTAGGVPVSAEERLAAFCRNALDSMGIEGNRTNESYGAQIADYLLRAGVSVPTEPGARLDVDALVDALRPVTRSLTTGNHEKWLRDTATAIARNYAASGVPTERLRAALDDDTMRGILMVLPPPDGFAAYADAVRERLVAVLAATPQDPEASR